MRALRWFLQFVVVTILAMTGAGEAVGQVERTDMGWPRLAAEYGDPLPGDFTAAQLETLALFDVSSWWPSVPSWMAHGRTPVADPFGFVRARNPDVLILAHHPGVWRTYSEPGGIIGCVDNAMMCALADAATASNAWLRTPWGTLTAATLGERTLDYRVPGAAEALAAATNATYVGQYFDGIRLEKADQHPYALRGAAESGVTRTVYNRGQLGGAQRFVDALDVELVGGTIEALDAGGAGLQRLDIIFVSLLGGTARYGVDGIETPRAERWRVAMEAAQAAPVAVLQYGGDLWRSGDWPEIKTYSQVQRLTLASATLIGAFATITGGQELSWCDECGVIGINTARSAAAVHWLGQPLGAAREEDGVWTREFERGMVIVNSTLAGRVVRVPVGFWRISGWYDRAHNNGQAVTEALQVDALDAYFLVRRGAALPTAVVPTATPTLRATATPTLRATATPHLLSLEERVRALETRVAELQR